MLSVSVIQTNQCCRRLKRFVGQLIRARCTCLQRVGVHYSSSALTQQPSHINITFLTDVEGDGNYFDRYVRNSKVLGFQSRIPCFDSSDRLKCNFGQWDERYFPYDRQVVFLEDDGMLVYGGDVWDKGGADLYVIRQLLSLRQRYPDRVHFLMGNRDINKLRIVDELGVWHDMDDDDAKNELPFHGGVYWLRGTKLKGDPEATNKVPTTASPRLKWMLQKTMGSVNAFELRKAELNRERAAATNSTCAFPSPGSPNHHSSRDQNSSVSVTNEEVTKSYMISCDPNYGTMGRYLAQAKLIIKIGPTLFMHGALPFAPNRRETHFPTPWLNANNEIETHVNSLKEWIHESNQFAADQIQEWQHFGNRKKLGDVICGGVWATQGSYSNSTSGGKAFGKLLQYGMNTLPDRKKNSSVVYNSWMNNGMPREDATYPCWHDFFTTHGLQIIATGHQPVGDMPWPIQIQASQSTQPFWIMPCDTSFSGETVWVSAEDHPNERINLGRGSGPSGRGDVAVCETLIKICTTNNTIISMILHGYLSDGTHYETTNLMDSTGCVSGKPYNINPIQFTDNNRKEEGIFWSKLKVGKCCLVSHGRGFNVWNALVPHTDEL